MIQVITQIIVTEDFIQACEFSEGMTATLGINGQGNKLEGTVYGILCLLDISFGTPTVGPGNFTSDVQHLLGQAHFRPSSGCQ